MTWTNAATGQTDWRTGALSHPPDGKQWRDGTVDDYNAGMVRYFPVARGAADAELPALALAHMNPYDYGFNVEVNVKKFMDASVAKHYSMGRVAIELS